VISVRPAHPALVSEDDFVAAQGVRAVRGTAPAADLAVPQRRYLLAGLLGCGVCGRRMESAWSNGKPAYRCRHGHTTAKAADPGRAKNTYVREDCLLPHLPALHHLLAGTQTGHRTRRRTRGGTDLETTASPEEVIGWLREHEITLTWDPATSALQAFGTDTSETVTITAC
jgi:site-specific DNA recombinase